MTDMKKITESYASGDKAYYTTPNSSITWYKNNIELYEQENADITSREENNYFSYKADKGKPRAGLMLEDFSNALMEVAKVSTFGAEKYAPHSWSNIEPERYKDALARHLFQYYSSEGSLDDESGLLHLAHLSWNCLALLELKLREDSK